MTTRDQLHRGAGTDRGDTPKGHRPRGDGTRGTGSDPTPSLPERLVTARERKGVDLYRAERDTKIRARYLAAMERGDYRELPGAVYTKGFLRNYALYLGLDPDDVLLQWRRERGGGTTEARPTMNVPRPIAAPRPALHLSPSLVVFAILAVAVIAFGAYLGVQVLRFTKPPTIAVTTPAAAVVEVEESTESYVLRGTTAAGATVSIATPGRDPYRVTADADGDWTANVELRRGRNPFEVSAVDPDTGKVSETSVDLLITVPFLTIEAPVLSLDQPAEGATFENGAIPVQGSVANATEVTVSARYVGPTGAAAGADPSPAPPRPPDPITVAVEDDGSFTTPLELTAGRWAVTVTATSTDGKSSALTRNVSVAFKGISLVVAINGGRAWLKVWVDGVVSDVTGVGGRVYGSGKVITFTGKTDIEVRTGNAAATYFTVNGVNEGRLSDKSNPGTWLFTAGETPERTDRR
jgi:cytoskeletal protein RodZ